MRPDAITVSELAFQMFLAFESRIDLRSGGSRSFANFVKHGGHGRFSHSTGHG
jgi:hypothetical protein